MGLGGAERQEVNVAIAEQLALNPPTSSYGMATSIKVGASWLNLQSEGADMSGASDTIPTWTSAFAKLPSGGGGIFVPPGTLLINSQLAVPKKVTVEGAGWTDSKAVGVAAGLGTTRILKNGNFDGVTLDECAVLRNIQVDGAGGNGGDGVWIINGRVVMDSVIITNQGAVGLRIGSKSAAQNSNLFHLNNLSLRGNTSHGVYIHDIATGGGTPNANGMIFGMETIDNGGDGLRLEHELNLWLAGFYGATNTGYGIRLINGAQGAAQGNNIWAAWTEGNTAGSALIDNGCTQNFIVVTNGTQAADSWVDNNTDGSNQIIGRINQSGLYKWTPFVINAPSTFAGKFLEMFSNGVSVLQILQNGNIQLAPAATTDISLNAGSSSSRILFGNNAQALFKMDFWGHLSSMYSGTPGVLTSLGVNVTSGTPAGNDMGGTLTIVVSGAVAAGAVIGTFSFVNSWPTTPKSVAFTPSSGANPTFGSLGYDSLGGTSFIVRNGPVAMSAGTYVFGYQVQG